MDARIYDIVIESMPLDVAKANSPNNPN
jgi:hypothetical protein